VCLGVVPATLEAIEEFVTGVRPRPAPDRVLATVLFTDLVDSTRRAVKMGDHAWREILDEHDRLAQSEIEGQGGQLSSDIRLVDRGLHSLKGVPGEWQLFSVEG
jgi:class 3 adenylate cyclase